MEGSLRLGRIGGIEIGVHFSWLLIFGLITWSLAVGFLPQNFPGWEPLMYWIVGALAAVLLFVSVLVHELAHSFVAIARGMPVKNITLFLFGGVSNVQREPEEPADELLMTIVGPLSSIALGVIFFLLLRALAGQPWVSEQVIAILTYLAVVNVLLAVFNLIPGFPLDGGRVFRSIVWWITGSLRKATTIAAAVGRIIAYLFIFGGLYLVFTGNILGGIWLMFIGWFMSSAAEQSARQVTVEETLRGIRVSRVMNPSPVTVPSDVTLQQLVAEYVLARNIRALPVVDGEHLVGMVTLSDVRHVPREEWDAVRVADVMRPATELAVLQPQDDLAEALRLMGERDLNQLPVVGPSGRLSGLLSRGNLIRYMQVREELGYQS